MNRRGVDSAVAMGSALLGEEPARVDDGIEAATGARDVLTVSRRACRA
jgi:hypothetical protein